MKKRFYPKNKLLKIILPIAFIIAWVCSSIFGFDGFPDNLNNTFLGVMFGMLFLALFFVMTFVFSKSKIYLTIFSIFFTFVFSALLCLIPNIFFVDFFDTKFLVQFSVIFLFLYELPIIDILMLIDNSFNIIATSVYISFIFIVAMFYITYFVSRYIKRKKRNQGEKEKLDANG